MNNNKTIGPVYNLNDIPDSIYAVAAVWNMRKNAEQWCKENGWPKSSVKSIRRGSSAMTFKQYVISDGCGGLLTESGSKENLTA